MVEVAEKVPTRSETGSKRKGLRASLAGLMLIIACPGDDIIPSNLDVEKLLSMMWVHRKQEEKDQEELARLSDLDLLLKNPGELQKNRAVRINNKRRDRHMRAEPLYDLSASDEVDLPDGPVDAERLLVETANLRKMRFNKSRRNFDR